MSVKLYKKIFMFVFARFNISLQIDVASDGDEAVKLVQAGNKYLIITMDIEMERVGGEEELFQAARSEARYLLKLPTRSCDEKATATSEANCKKRLKG